MSSVIGDFPSASESRAALTGMLKVSLSHPLVHLAAATSAIEYAGSALSRAVLEANRSRALAVTNGQAAIEDPMLVEVRVPIYCNWFGGTLNTQHQRTNYLDAAKEAVGIPLTLQAAADYIEERLLGEEYLSVKVEVTAAPGTAVNLLPQEIVIQVTY